MRFKNQKTSTRLLLLAVLLAGVMQACRDRKVVHHEPAQFVGVQACKSCHPTEYEAWSGSDHDLAMQPANAQTVLGDFEDASFTYYGLTSRFYKKDGKFFAFTDGPDGKLHEYEIAYTFGHYPLQQYLIAFPKGRYQALNVCWDTRPDSAGGQRWFHLYPNEKIEARDILHWTGGLQNWNFMCAECHSTNLQKNYHAAKDSFATTWSEINVSCEACHGPGSHHVPWAKEAAAGHRLPARNFGLVFALKDTSEGTWTFPAGATIAKRTKPLASRVELETCARCHARRAQVWRDYDYGQPLAQTHRAAFLDEPLYHADGQILDEVYEYASFVQSKMYQAGVTCSDCHDPHSMRIRWPGNAVCLQCHLPAKYDVRQHHFHKVGTAAAQCVSCHMIQRNYMVVDGRRDHSFRVPRPDLSVRLGTSNACNDCHKDRSAQWSADSVAKWYGPNRISGWHYAEALAAGRKGSVDAESQLVRTVEDAKLPAMVRATALSLLPRYLSQGSLHVVEVSLRDSDPLIRRAAAAALSAVEPQTRVALGLPLLNDPIRTVRLEVVSPLLEIPPTNFTAEQLLTLEHVLAEYRDVQAFNADRAESYLNLGALEAQLGKFAEAESAYRTAMQKQDSFIPAYINLADLYRQQGLENDAEQALRQALQVDPSNGDAYYALGLSLARQKRLREATTFLEKASQLRPDVSRYAYAYAIALHDAKELKRALEVLATAQKRHPADRDILVALVEYSREAGDQQAADSWEQKLGR